MTESRDSTRLTQWAARLAEPRVPGVTGEGMSNVNVEFPARIGLVGTVAGPKVKADPKRGLPRFVSGIRAWMVVPAVDFVLMLAPIAWRPPQIYATVALAVLATMLLNGSGRHIAPLHLSVLDQLPFLVTRLLTAIAAVCAAILLIHHKSQVAVFLETACQAAGLVILGRVVTARLIAWGRSRGIAERRTVLIGGGSVAGELARILDQHHEYGLRIVGFVDDDEQSQVGSVPRLGSVADLDSAVRAARADSLLMADGVFDESEAMQAVRTNECRNRELMVVPRMHQFHTLTGMADHVGSIPIMRIRNLSLRGPARLVKRLFDIAAASIALIVLSPLLITVALALRIEGGPGIIFRQTRVGLNGGQFELLKFRSMRPANERESQTQWSVANDSRVTPLGRLIRATSVDELPQLWNILLGDMTLVGPRPERPHFVEQFCKEVDRYADRHRVKVGLTGLAQVSGLRGDTSITDRARFDNYYIENWSLWLDIKIILRTFREVIFYREGRN
jgi:exopolysaccharide biosynthesis polyprenyl glycosylphosphotransferase